MKLTVQFTVFSQELTPIPHSTANQYYGAGVQAQNMIHAGNWQNKRCSEQKGTVLAQFYTNC